MLKYREQIDDDYDDLEEQAERDGELLKRLENLIELEFTAEERNRLSELGVI